MKIATGNSVSELTEMLKEMDELTRIDSIIPPGSKSYIEFVKNKNHTQWRLIGSAKNLADAKSLKRGLTLKSFEEALKAYEKEAKLFNTDSDYSVLCHRDTQPYQDPLGKASYVSTWFKLPLGTPYLLQDGQPVFETEVFYVSEADHKLLMETGLMFGKDGNHYPIMDSALASVSTVLDASRLIYSLDEKLGVALLFSEKLASSNGIRFLYRETESGLRPITTLISTRYAKTEMTNYFEKIFSRISECLNYEVVSWSAASQQVNVSIKVSHPDFLLTYGIDICISDALGDSFRAKAYAFYKGERFVIHEEKISHRVDAGQMPENLIQPVIKSIVKNNSSYEQYCFSGQQSGFWVRVRESDLKTLQSIIGKKRSDEIKNIGEKYNPIEWLERISKLKSKRMKVVQAERLDFWRGSLFVTSLEEKKED